VTIGELCREPREGTMHKLEVILQMVFVCRGFSRDIQGLKKQGFSL